MVRIVVYKSKDDYEGVVYGKDFLDKEAGYSELIDLLEGRSYEPQGRARNSEHLENELRKAREDLRGANNALSKKKSAQEETDNLESELRRTKRDRDDYQRKLKREQNKSVFEKIGDSLWG